MKLVNFLEIVFREKIEASQHILQAITSYEYAILPEAFHCTTILLNVLEAIFELVMNTQTIRYNLFDNIAVIINNVDEAKYGWQRHPNTISQRAVRASHI